MADKADDPGSAIRRTFGRGFAEACKTMGADIGEVMNLAKIRQLEQSLNGQARKVYEAVPIGRAVSVHEVMIAVKSTIGRPEINVVEACLNTLADKGLAKVTKEGKFQRVQATTNGNGYEDKIMVDQKTAPARDFPRSESPFAQLRARVNDAVNALAEVDRLCGQIEVESGKLMKLREALDGLR